MDTVNPTLDMQEGLLVAARALDNSSPEEALGGLRRLPLAGSQAARLVALALWKRLALIDDTPLRCEDRQKVARALDDLGAGLKDEAHIWTAYRAIPRLEKAIGARDAAAAVAALLWDRVLAAHEGVFATTFELFFRSGEVSRCREAWHRFLSARKDHVPHYWHVLSYCRLRQSGDRNDIATDVGRMLEASDRDDLKPLIAIYLMQMRQADCRTVCSAALRLEEPRHRARIAEYMMGMGYMPEDLPMIVAAFRELTDDKAAQAFMEARLANADRRWPEVLAAAERAGESHQYGPPARLLAAHALGNLEECEKARREIQQVSEAPLTPDYLRARAAFIRVNVELAAKRLPAPEFSVLPEFGATPGRPLAQSLWVGKRLRWIERLAIRSYLDNGWRFQLYAYDDVENAPAGCELLDANAVLPRKDIFREGFGSGLHAGSLGAFSDLFRYRLLHQRGGMWTDTDVINLKRFDPDGRRFISTEITDAGLVTLNGAIMAAPAGHPFVARAYERACELLRADGMFFTRIGPYLLAELLVEAGVEAMTLMPPHFLSAVFWMNTAALLDPHESFRQRIERQDAVNLHVYTEMWRMLGLGLDKPPSGDTFLGKLYADKFGDEVPDGGRRS